MKILIAGDLGITQTYSVSNQIDQEVIDLFSSSDLNIVNLEVPVTDSTIKIRKTGPNIKACQESISNVLRELKFNVATLANNHLMDYGEIGVEDTLNFCKKMNILSVGGGMNLEQASRVLYIESTIGKIGIVNFAENEWVAATAQSAGFNPMDVIDNSKQIREAKQNSDFVIVIIHGGHEYYNLPSPRMVKMYRFYADQGADLIVGHHTHCISGNEVYNGVPIYYSLGNFLFDRESTYEEWYKGLILEVNIKDGKCKVELHPVSQSKEKFCLKLLQEKEKTELLAKIQALSKIVVDKAQLKVNWENFIKIQKPTYLNYWSPISFIKNKYLRALCRKFKLRFFTKRTSNLHLNLLRCETHREMSIYVLEDLHNRK